MKRRLPVLLSALLFFFFGITATLERSAPAGDVIGRPGTSSPPDRISRHTHPALQKKAPQVVQVYMTSW